MGGGQVQGPEDDVLLFASSITDLQLLLGQFTAECDAPGTKIPAAPLHLRPWSSVRKGWFVPSKEKLNFKQNWSVVMRKELS